MSLVVGSAMLIAGMKASQSLCSVMGNTFLGKSLSKAAAIGPAYAGKAFDYTKNLALGGAAKGIGGGARLAGGLVRGTAKYTGKGLGLATNRLARVQVGQGVNNDGSKKGFVKRWTGKTIRGIGKTGALATDRGRADLYTAMASGEGRFARTMAPGLEKRAAKLNAVRQGEIAVAGDKYKEASSTTKINQLKRFAKNGHSVGGLLGGKKEAIALFKELLENPDMMEDFRKEGGDIAGLNERYGSELTAAFKGDAKTQKSYKKFKKQFAHQTKSKNPAQAAKDLEELKTEEDWRNLDAHALLDEEVRARAESTFIDVKDKGGTLKRVKVSDRIAAGGMGGDKRDIWEKRGDALDEEEFRLASPSQIISASSPGLARRAMSVAVKDGDINRGGQVLDRLVESYQGPNTTDEQRFNVSTSIDSVVADLEKTIAADPKKQKEVKKKLDEFKKKLEAAQGAVVGANKSKFGTLGSIGTRENAESFVRDTLANASDERRADASQQVDTEIETRRQKIAESQTKEAETIRGSSTGLQDQARETDRVLTTVRQQAGVARQSAAKMSAITVKRLEADIAFKNVRVKELNGAKADAMAKGDTAGLADFNRQQGELAAEIAKLNTQIATAKNIDADPEVVRLEAARLAAYDAHTKKLEEFRAFSADELAAVKALRAEREKIEQEVTKLTSVATTIRDLRNPPPTA